MTKRTGAGSRSAAARWIASARRTGCSRARRGGPVEAALVDGHDVEVVPRQADGVLEVEAQDGLVGQPVDRRQRLGRAPAPTRSTPASPSSASSTTARWAPSTARASSALVSRATRHRRARSSLAGARSMRHAATTRRPAAGGAPRRRCGAAGRRRRRRSAGRGRAPGRRAGRAGRPGRPPTVTTMRSPAPARRTAAASSARSARTPIVWTHVYTSRFATCRASPARLPAMNFAFTEEQEELRKTVRAFLEAKSPETAVREQMETEDGYDAGGLDADGRADGPAGPAHPRGVRRLGLQLRRARHRARGDGPGAAVRAVLLDRRARRQHAAPVRRRRGQEGLPARHRQRRDDRHARLHRAVGQVGRVGHHDGGHAVGRRLHARPARRCSCSTATPPT